jgi:threonine synthase
MTSNERAARSDTKNCQLAQKNRSGVIANYCLCRLRPHLSHLVKEELLSLRAGTFGASLQMQDLRVKDESQNPTQSFKARGMSVAVSMAKHLGASKLVAPSAGNAASALAAYAARAGLEAHVFMPRDTPRANIIECRELGARVTLIDGLITDCAC